MFPQRQVSSQVCPPQHRLRFPFPSRVLNVCLFLKERDQLTASLILETTHSTKRRAGLAQEPGAMESARWERGQKIKLLSAACSASSPAPWVCEGTGDLLKDIGPLDPTDM